MRVQYLLAVALGVIVGAGVARAADVSIVGKKLVIVDKIAIASRAKAVFVAKDLGVTKGTGTDSALISGHLDVSYDTAAGTFLAPQGSGWLVNKDTVAKYVNKTAPTGGSTKVTVIKPEKLIKLAAKSLGDTPIDISQPPTGDVLAVYSVVNDAETDRLCTAFQDCAHKVIAGGTGYKLVCKLASGATCPTPTTTTTTIPGTSTSTSTSTSSTTSTSESTSTSTSSTTSTSTSTSTSSSSTTSTSSSTSTSSTTLAGPAFPPSGGSVTHTFSGADSAGDSGGRNVEFSSFSPSSWSRLYWGPSSAALPSASLSGIPGNTTLAFVSAIGDTATWQSDVSWTNPGPGSPGPFMVPVLMTITITSGGLTWQTSGSVPGLDPGPGTGIGAVVADFPTAVDFTANVKFEADIPTDVMGFIPLNSVPQGTGGATLSSFTGAFYSAP